MEKEIEKIVTEFCDDNANEQMEQNDKNCGTAASLKEHDVITIKGGTYVTNIRTYEDEDAATADGVTKNRMKVQEDGTVKVDNSYYAILTDGPVSTVSLRSLTSWAQLESCPDDALKIPAGRASGIFGRVAPLKGRSAEVVAVEEWDKGKKHNGREQRFAGRALAFRLLPEEKKGE